MISTAMSEFLGIKKESKDEDIKYILNQKIFDEMDSYNFNKSPRSNKSKSSNNSTFSDPLSLPEFGVHSPITNYTLSILDLISKPSSELQKKIYRISKPVLDNSE